MRLLDGLQTGAATLMAQSHGARVHGHNVANVNTPGYHRQQTVLQNTPAPTSGVRVADVQRHIDTNLEARMRGAMGEHAQAKTRAQGLQQLEGHIGKLGEDGLDTRIGEFFAGWRELSAAPGDRAARRQVISQGERLAGDVNRMAGALAAQRQDLDTNIQRRVEQADTLLGEVAQLNQKIVASEGGGQRAADLRDHRGQKLASLAELLGTKSSEQSNGAVTVLAGGGMTLVDGAVHRSLGTRARADGHHQIVFTDRPNTEIGTRLRGGEVAGMLALRDDVLPKHQNTLDQWAFDLANAVNGVHQAGTGRDGVSGRDFFSAPSGVAGAAEQLSVNPTVAAATDAVAAGQSAAAGDNRAAADMVALEDDAAAMGGQETFAGAVRELAASVGEQRRAARAAAQQEEMAVRQLETAREQQSGVSIEEEMMMLERHQRGYQAASRVVTSINEMLDGLLRI